jgi:hypothetical protein
LAGGIVKPPADVAELGRLLREIAAIGTEPDSSVDRDGIKAVVREVFAECGVDTLPYCYTVETAIAATGLSESRIRGLIREEVLAVRQEGVKLFIVGTSLRRYIDSLPPRGLK